MFRISLFVAVVTLCAALPHLQAQDVIVVGPEQKEPPRLEEDVTQGALRIETEDGQIVECPLKHTDVGAAISGFIARVKVVQTFANPFDERIEAVYVFPLPHTAAVDDMTMVIGERRIVGIIKRRAVARRIYEEALAAGKTASLLEQERPNIFTQSVGNIDPGQEIRIEISYVDVLKYDMGIYEFHFPMVVGPRYIPGGPISGKAPVPPELQGKVGEIPDATGTGAAPTGTGWSPDTDRVPDASRITPPVLKPGHRTGHDIALFVTLDAGVPIQDLQVPTHQAEVKKVADSRADVRLSPQDSIPNKDFVLRYEVVGEKPALAVLAHAARPGEGYFMLMMQPKVDESLKQAPPREICFLIDVSGSMRGEPTEAVKREMAELLKRVKAEDRLQVITFAGSTKRLFPASVPATEDNIRKALDFTQAQRGGGGTEMLKGIQEVLADPVDPQRVRIVIMLTDGFIGNEAEIIKEVGTRCGDFIRFWAIGIGSSPNRFLIDGVAQQGGGMGKTLNLTDDPAPLAGEIMERIHRAQLAKIEIDWGSLPVFETYPAKIPELWAGKPVILFGRYEAGAASWAKIKGLVEGQPAEFPLYVSLPENEPAHEVLAKVWARNKIEDLMVQNYLGDPTVEEEITLLALRYRLMSQFTSFVAVDEAEQKTLTEPVNPPRRVPVAIPLPLGVSYEGVFGPAGEWGTREAAELADTRSLGTRAYFSRGDIAKIGRGEYRGAAIDRLTAGYGWFADGAMRVPVESETTLARFGYPGIGGNGRLGGSGGRYGLGSPVRGTAARQASASTRGRAPTSLAALSVESLAEAPSGPALGNLPADPVLAEKAPKLHEAAAARVSAASGAETVSELEAARARLRLAYLLEHGFLALNPWNDSGLEAALFAQLESVEESLTDRQVKENQSLGKTLDLVLRHETVESVLAEIARAAGVKISLVEGSVEDAKELLMLPRLTITYQDLRGANPAQALTWITGPFNLEWRVAADGSVLVGTARRLDGASAWVYPVADLLVPMEEEAGEGTPDEKQKKAQEAFTHAVETLRSVVMEIFGETPVAEFKSGAADLITPGELLVYGDPAVHAKAARLLAVLRDPKAAIGDLAAGKAKDQLEELRKLTAARWETRKEVREKAAERMAMARTLGSLADPSWQLLAAAANGELDPAAFAELESACRSEEMNTLFAKGLSDIPYRSLFAITQAARTLPGETEIQKLAADAVAQAGRSFQIPEKDVKPEQIVAVLYALQAFDDARALGIAGIPSEDRLAEARKWVVEHKGQVGIPLGEAVIEALVNGLSEKSGTALTESIRKREFAGTDLLVLEAFLARRAGGPVWEAFRQEKSDLIGAQPVDGPAVVLVNRLATARLPIVGG